MACIASYVLDDQALVTDVRLAEYTNEYLELSFHWLSDREMLRMTRAQRPTREGQAAWFRNLPLRSDYLVWGVEVDGQPVGAAGIKAIADNQGEMFWFLGEKRYWGRGIATRVTRLIEQAAAQMGLRRLISRVGTDNPASLRVHEKAGWSVVGDVGDLRTLEKVLG